MSRGHAERIVRGLCTGVLSPLLFAAPAVRAEGQSQVPARVMDALKARFPKAEIDKWTRETEGRVVLYDIEFRQEGRKFEADIREDGTIDNWEEAIAAADLPEAVTRAVQGKYPNCTLREIMAITAVKDGQEVLEGYEIVLQTADKKDVEVTVAPDGKILEEGGEES